MLVSRVRLTDYRSYPSVDIALEPGVTTLVGANGQGKTNLVEAIGYAATLSSHRVATDAPLVREGAQRAVIGVDAVRDDRDVLVEIEITPGRANRGRLNRSPVTRVRDVLGVVRTVLFAPEDLALVKSDPSERRRFLDEVLIQRAPRLQGVKSDYERVLKQRNALLKSAATARRNAPDAMIATLEVWDEQLAEAGAQLLQARTALLVDLEPRVATAYAGIAGPDMPVQLEYESSVATPVTPTAQEWKTSMLEAISARRKDELDRGVSLVGPHRDDVRISLEGRPARGFASHGESWSLALALRLASLEVLRSDGDEPILILDDVFAELDSQRRRHLIEQVMQSPQVLITAAVPADVPDEVGGQRLTVTRGRIERG
mgnify:CR=1 FL=1